MRKNRLLSILCAALVLLAAGCTERSAPAAAPAAAPLAAEVSPAPAVDAGTPAFTPTPSPMPTPSPTPSPSPEPTPCRHYLWVDGVCAYCGEACPHPGWENGRCTQCSLTCRHPSHDENTLICSQCGQAVPHNFLHSRCDMCGLKPVFSGSVIGLKNFNANKQSGTVQTVTYLTHDYYTEGQTWGYAPLYKKMCVYLPYGYNTSEKYDVLILLHGTEATERYWLREAHQITNVAGYGVFTTDLLDNLMASGYCRKMIVVTPTFYRNSGDWGDYQRERDEEQFVKELRNDILPFLAANYSTYARGDSPEDIAAARAHFAYAGLSMGSIYTWTCVIPNCLDLFGWYGCFSGSNAHMDRILPVLTDPENADYPIYFFYNSVGAKDDMYDTHFNQYYELVNKADCLTDGDNAAFTAVNMCGHDYRAWGTGLYNFLRVVFAQPRDE